MSREKNAGEYLAERFTQPQAASSTQAGDIENFTARFTMARQILREHGNAGLVALLDQLADKAASSTTPVSTQPVTDAMVRRACLAYECELDGDVYGPEVPEVAMRSALRAALADAQGEREAGNG